MTNNSEQHDKAYPHPLEEDADRWENRSPFDEPDEWGELEIADGGRKPGHLLAVRLDARTIDMLASVGRRVGLGPSSLARNWLLARLAEEEARDEALNRSTSDAAPAKQGS